MDKIDLERNFKKIHFNVMWKFSLDFKNLALREVNIYRNKCGKLCGKILYQGGI
ncbi:MAG: hypothetical protein ABDH49_03115 [Candidatus Hydrothermales bacterium]